VARAKRNRAGKNDSVPTPSETSAQNGKKPVRRTGPDELSDSDRSWLQHFIETGNATEAEARVSNSSMNRGAISSNAKRRMKKPAIQKALADLRAKQMKRYEISADRVLGELARIALTDVRDVIDWGDTVCVKDAETGEIRTVNSVAIKAAKDITPEAAAAIASIEQSKDGGIKIKFHDKRAALVDLGKHLGIFKIDNEQAGKAAAEAAAAAAQNPRDIARAVLAVIQEANKGQGKAQGNKT
jgi:phage terminase small subunit